jgi:DNA-binding IclR family transcriptional regulator
VIAVVQKLFDILETFSEEGDPMPLAKISARTRLPKPTAYRLPRAMVELGYLTQDPPTGQYLRTPALQRLSSNCSHRHLLERVRGAI